MVCLGKQQRKLYDAMPIESQIFGKTDGYLTLVRRFLICSQRM
ncbi:3020_t:CDS:1, partial [Ambispora leptoticha]